LRKTTCTHPRITYQENLSAKKKAFHGEEGAAILTDGVREDMESSSSYKGGEENYPI